MFTDLVELVSEHLGEKSYTVGFSNSGREVHEDEISNLEETTIPPGSIFVLGDNRLNSSDSRTQGPIPIKNITGRARFIWWSSGPDGFRFDRIGEVQ